MKHVLKAILNTKDLTEKRTALYELKSMSKISIDRLKFIQDVDETKDSYWFSEMDDLEENIDAIDIELKNL